ncbi:MAG TPA: type II toxin-antitoxin system death-on-curing family toxin [Ktedonobacteraceae bacterium]|nr:type II toxin-antitoxin system death-on-curing family toxin [Ktedonobacteraceae bacterium]
MKVKFVPTDVVMRIHDDQIQAYGGSLGLRDRGLLDSALHMPCAQFDGEFLHPTIGAMAAAYGFHLCKNHAFVDGNKRTAYTVMCLFLELNGMMLKPDSAEHDEIILAVSDGSMSKDAFIEWVEQTVQMLLPEHLESD